AFPRTSARLARRDLRALASPCCCAMRRGRSARACSGRTFISPVAPPPPGLRLPASRSEPAHVLSRPRDVLDDRAVLVGDRLEEFQLLEDVAEVLGLDEHVERRRIVTLADCDQTAP